LKLFINPSLVNQVNTRRNERTEKDQREKSKNRNSTDIIIYVIASIITLWALKQLVKAFINITWIN